MFVYWLKWELCQKNRASPPCTSSFCVLHNIDEPIERLFNSETKMLSVFRDGNNCIYMALFCLKCSSKCCATIATMCNQFAWINVTKKIPSGFFIKSELYLEVFVVSWEVQVCLFVFNLLTRADILMPLYWNLLSIYYKFSFKGDADIAETLTF